MKPVMGMDALLVALAQPLPVRARVESSSEAGRLHCPRWRADIAIFNYY